MTHFGSNGKSASFVESFDHGLDILERAVALPVAADEAASLGGRAPREVRGPILAATRRHLDLRCESVTV
jgi:hypothetical protein